MNMIKNKKLRKYTFSTSFFITFLKKIF